MRKILKVKNVGDYSRYMGAAEQHPLICVIDYAKYSPVPHTLNDYSVYGLFFMDDDSSLDLTYGCGRYDYREGTLICVAPGQIGGKEDNGERINLSGWAVLFHPDLLHGTHLEKKIREYSFFDYSVNEALHLTDEEREILTAIFRQLNAELDKKPDGFQKEIIVSYVELILSYCGRFYNRQFMTRRLDNNDILSRFTGLLHDYFDSGEQLETGIPTVQYCAEKLCMSANYFSDVIKRMTGVTPSSYIRRHVVQIVKNRLAGGANIAEVAYELGFSYPQHLSRMFKNCEGISPSQYLASLSNGLKP